MANKAGRPAKNSFRGLRSAAFARLRDAGSTLSKEAQNRLYDVYLANRNKAEEKARHAAYLALMSLRDSTLRVGQGAVMRIESVPGAQIGASLAVPLLAEVGTRMLNSRGERTSKLSSEESALARISPQGFGQSSKSTDWNLTFGDPRRMPRMVSNIRETETKIYQGNWVDQATGKWDESETVEQMDAGFNIKRTRFFAEGAGCLAERQLRRLLSNKSRNKPNACSGTGTGDAFDITKNDQQYSLYNPYKIKAKTTVTNINSNFAARVTFRMVCLKNLQGTTNYPVDRFDEQFSKIPDVFKIKNNSGSVITPTSRQKYHGLVHHALGQSNQGVTAAIDCLTLENKDLFSHSDIENFRVLQSKTVVLQPGETFRCNIENIYNTNFEDRGFSTLYGDEFTFCGSGYVGLAVEVKGIRGNAYEVDWDGSAVTDREFLNGTLPAQVAVNQEISMCNYWLNSPTYNTNPSNDNRNILYQRLYEADFAINNVSSPAYYRSENVIAGEQALPAGVSAKKLIVPVNTSRVIRAASTGIRAETPVNEEL